jgi:hypothetical protein
MSKPVSESEIQYEQVKKYFWRPEEADFVIRFSESDMCQWQEFPTPSFEEMRKIRRRLAIEDSEFAGFIRHEGRYCFYFCDKNFLKVQYLDNGEIDYFGMCSFPEIDLSKVAKEYRLLQGS